ncbi:MAG: HIT family protein [Patescibacteria group bacterium]|nr:HIT family protein [Patescibacteria group bacterium]
MEDCIFCKIIKGEIPSAKVWENEDFLAFLTIAPINPGHTLIIPKKHTDYIFDLDDETLGKILVVSRPIARAIEKAFHPATGRVGIMVAGLAVPHAHVHLIPMNAERDLDFNKAQNVPFEEIQANAQKIKDNL